MFEARMTHTEGSCLRLARVQNICFGKERKTVRLILAAIPFLLGYAIGLDTTVGVLFIVFACFFYYKTSLMFERDAKKAFQQTPKKFMVVEYKFDEHVLKVYSGGIEKRIAYSSLYAMVSDKEYVYLFVNKQQAYMLSLETLVPENRQMFCESLPKWSGKRWKYVSIVEHNSFRDFLKGNRKRNW